MHTNGKGNITELEVAISLMKKNYSVFVPLGDGNKVDLIFIKEGVTKKVQVKSPLFYKGRNFLDLRHSCGVKRARTQKYYSTDIDFFGTVFEGNVYLFPIKDMETKSTITISDKYIVI